MMRIIRRLMDEEDEENDTEENTAKDENDGELTCHCHSRKHSQDPPDGGGVPDKMTSCLSSPTR